ncbi:MAG: DUF1559 domain-containing protein [Phycisphaeraceae bacterium]|nr:DUF1559 domain-containing protein [Phycisphaeraceae bacterium]
MNRRPVPSRPIRTRAFTLVEALVSVAVIALLLGILLPGLGSSREAARTVVCLSNQRQLGLAWMMYAHDHREHAMPLAYTDERDVGSGDGIFWWGTDGAATGTIDHAAGLISPYLAGWLGERSVFECPSQPIGTYIPQGSPSIPEAERITSTYGYNGYYLTPDKTPGWSATICHQPWKRIHDIERPADLLVFADTLLVTNPARPGRSTALLDPPMLYRGYGQWEPNPHPTTAFRHGITPAARPGYTGNAAAAMADGSARTHAAQPDWILQPSHRVGSVGTSNEPAYIPDWKRWR